MYWDLCFHKHMELKEFVAIFSKDRRVFFGIILGCIVLGMLVFRFQPERYQATLSLNVTRGGAVATDEYRYDQFYRLQADERFADTVVRWIAAPDIRGDIDDEAGVKAGVIRNLEAKRLSSQMIAVTYEARSGEAFGRYAKAVATVVNRESASLNEQAKASDWFIVAAGDPAVGDARIGFAPLALGGLFAGLFLAFWTVLVRRYWRKG